MAYPKILAYQYPLKLKLNSTGEIETFETPIEVIDLLLLGYPWHKAFTSYFKRSRFYWGFSVSGFGDELFPVIDAKIELEIKNLTNPRYLLEVAVMPNKLKAADREAFDNLLTTYLRDDDFKIWWDNDPRGPRNRSFKEKNKIIDEIKKLAIYKDEDDLKLEDIEVSIDEALQFFSFEKGIKPKEAAKCYKKRLKELQLSLHPDSATGNEEKFLYLQKCRTVVEKYLRRYI